MHTAQALSTILADLFPSQAAMAEAAGVDASVLNRVIRGGAMSAKLLAVVVKVLPRDRAADLVTAWLRDWLGEEIGKIMRPLSAQDQQWLDRIYNLNPEKRQALEQFLQP